MHDNTYFTYAVLENIALVERELLVSACVWYVVSCHVMSCHVMSCRRVLCHVTSHHVASRLSAIVNHVPLSVNVIGASNNNKHINRLQHGIPARVHSHAPPVITHPHHMHLAR